MNKNTSTAENIKAICILHFVLCEFRYFNSLKTEIKQLYAYIKIMKILLIDSISFVVVLNSSFVYTHDMHSLPHENINIGMKTLSLIII